MSGRALVTGAGGQDGSYLAELLVAEGYDVVGIVRDADAENENLAAVRDAIELVSVDLLDQEALASVLRTQGTTEIYNLASPSFVPRSWDRPVETAEFAAVGVTSLLEAVRAVDTSIRVYQASSSEIFGEPVETPQSEATPLSPVTPYGVAKAYGHFIIGSYRRRYGLHASGGILYNHESPRRPLDFLPSKVAHAAAAISLGLGRELLLGDLDAQRDWGYAPDYVDAMRRIVGRDEPGDYVIATGELHTVRELTETAFSHVGLDWSEHVRVDPALLRGQAELHRLVGDASKARDDLGWRPSVGFDDLVRRLVDAARDRLTSS
ncbi:MAG: GDPmannose 4,6-dehydratase [Gaiellaceae bacterium]|nr:GDPmannose 4,6-dehydratase [Gaiellaceae bacterium]MDX6468941.1 GDPmannose 4,6-dehydratase [Gaiellaceae bacterium]MDX6472156.1 GDPmannose 4,6-dehydratase [Gaiellaceae bacterium]